MKVGSSERCLLTFADQRRSALHSRGIYLRYSSLTLLADWAPSLSSRRFTTASFSCKIDMVYAHGGTSIPNLLEVGGRDNYAFSYDDGAAFSRVPVM